MNSEDVLVTYISEIANAEMAELPDYTDAKTTVGEAKYLAIRDLAAALRAERERTERDWVRAAIPCVDCPTPDIRSYFRRWYENYAVERDELKRLRERVAELEKTLALTRISNDALRERAFGAEARVAELENKLSPPCGDPSIDAFYLKDEAARKEETCS